MKASFVMETNVTKLSRFELKTIRKEKKVLRINSISANKITVRTHNFLSKRQFVQV